MMLWVFFFRFHSFNLGKLTSHDVHRRREVNKGITKIRRGASRGIPGQHKATKTRLFGKTIVVNLFKSVKMILNTLIIWRFLWLLQEICRRDFGHGPSQSWRSV